MSNENENDGSDVTGVEKSKDPLHYFTNVTILVEDTLFRVPRQYFEQESDVFRGMFQLPIADDTVADGCSDEQPLRLDGVTKTDFRQLLRVMVPLRGLAEETLSLEEWTSILKLATMWQMDRLRSDTIQRITTCAHEASDGKEAWITVLDFSTLHGFSDTRALAIERLSDNKTIMLTGVDKILLARKYKVGRWLKEGFRELVKRPRRFSDDEDNQLGLKTVVKLYRLREEYRHRVNSTNLTQTRHRQFGIEPVSVRRDVEREFEDELMEVDCSLEAASISPDDVL